MKDNNHPRPLVSIIVPCYNGAEYIKETLERLLRQSFSSWECIIVNDGSTDDSEAIALYYAKKDKRFSYLPQENKGVSAARNAGIKLSKGDYILPLDADDKISSAYMKEAIDILTARPGVKVVYAQAELFGDRKGTWKLPEYSLKELLVENLLYCSAFFRREDFFKTAGYDENMAEGFEDWDFWIGFLGDGGDVYKIPRVHFYYRTHKDSRNSQVDIEKQKNLRKRIYEKHKSLYDKYWSGPDAIFELYRSNTRYNTVVNSGKMKLMRILSAPFRLFMKFFK